VRVRVAGQRLAGRAQVDRLGSVARSDLGAVVDLHRPEVAVAPLDLGLARSVRFDGLGAIDPAGPVDWAELAGRAGYYDQAHFGDDFRAFTGLTPTRYLDVRRRFLREHPGHVLDVGPLPAD